MSTPLPESDVAVLRSAGMQIAPDNTFAEATGVRIRIRVSDDNPDQYLVWLVLDNAQQLLLTVDEDKFNIVRKPAP
jgi:hypothetical protein